MEIITTRCKEYLCCLYETVAAGDKTETFLPTSHKYIPHTLPVL
jgi:hypothetical protein